MNDYSITLTWDTDASEERPTRIDFIDCIGRRTRFIRESDAQIRALDAARTVAARLRPTPDNTERPVPWTAEQLEAARRDGKALAQWLREQDNTDSRGPS